MGLLVGNGGKENAAKIKDFLNSVNTTEDRNDPAYKHCVKADALRLQNYFAESIKEYQVAISHDYKNILAYKGLAISYKKLGKFEKAVSALEKAKKLQAFDKTIYFELGRIYLNIKPCKALKEFKTALKIDPEYMEAKMNLAMAHEVIDEVSLAIDILKTIIQDKPSYLAAYYNLGSLYMRIGMYKECIDTFKRIISVNPDFSKAYLGIGVAYDKMKSANESIRWYKKYLKIKPNCSNALYVEDRIERVRAERVPSGSNRLQLIVNND